MLYYNFSALNKCHMRIEWKWLIDVRTKLMSEREIKNVFFLGNTENIWRMKTHGILTFTKAYLCAKVGPI